MSNKIQTLEEDISKEINSNERLKDDLKMLQEEHKNEKLGVCYC